MNEQTTLRISASTADRLLLAAAATDMTLDEMAEYYIQAGLTAAAAGGNFRDALRVVLEREASTLAALAAPESA